MRALPVTLRALQARTGLRRVLVAYGLYGLVEFSIWLAVILYVFAADGARTAGVVTVIQLVPASMLAPALAAIGDRLPRGRALALAYAGVTATVTLTLIAILASAPLPLVVAASTTATVAVAVVRPIHFAALPQLSRTSDHLVSANSLSSVLDGVAAFLGPVLAGFGAAYAGPWLVFAGAAIAAAVATLLSSGLHLGRAAADEEADGWRAAFQGLRSLRGDWPALTLLVLLTTTFFLAGALDVLGVAFSVDTLHHGQSGAGLVVGAIGIGGLVGAAAAALIARRRRLGPAIVLLGVAEGAGFAVVSVVSGLGAAMVVIALVGAAEAMLMVCGRTLLQRAIDDAVLARVFAVQEGMSLVGLAVGAASVSLLLGWLDPAQTFVPLGAGAVALALGSAWFIRRLDDRAVYLPYEIRLLRTVGFLAVLPEFELERLARNARWTEVTAGTDVVVQGEDAQDFYVIADGLFTVTVDGVARPQTLAPGHAFGEVALLRSVPRTATVTARSPARLLVLSGADFLAAVTGSADGHALASEVADAHRARDLASALRQEPPSGS
ncbi:MAG TPA: cyclic nucleotide-binding domain-containing protein [Actinomycetes bacterium]|nr:cyclic nucleotide-binding domain-containing protein [Actinomycetes bacterium]